MYVNIYVYTYTYIYIDVPVCMFKFVCVRACVRARVCMRVRGQPDLCFLLYRFFYTWAGPGAPDPCAPRVCRTSTLPPTLTSARLPTRAWVVVRTVVAPPMSVVECGVWGFVRVIICLWCCSCGVVVCVTCFSGYRCRPRSATLRSSRFCRLRCERCSNSPSLPSQHRATSSRASGSTRWR